MHDPPIVIIIKGWADRDFPSLAPSFCFRDNVILMKRKGHVKLAERAPRVHCRVPSYPYRVLLSPPWLHFAVV